VENIMKKLSVIFTVAIAMLFVSNPALAEGVTVPADGSAGDAGWVAVGAGLAIGLAAFGGALGQGNTAKAAMEGMSRNPSKDLLVPMIIAMALTESLVILAFLVASGLSGKI
jgi:F-type H+-transporting ATPase subunit c